MRSLILSEYRLVWLDVIAVAEIAEQRQLHNL